MANPQPTDAHLRIAHEISEQLMVSHFTAKQRRILDLVLRLSWGCGKKDAIIPRQSDFEVVGIFQSDIKGELDLLERDGVIIRDDDTYRFNKDYDKWRVSRARGYTHAKVSELLSINLNHNLVNHQVNGGQNLVNHQETTKQITKKPLSDLLSSPATDLATPKETLKKDIKEESISIDKIVEICTELFGQLGENVTKELRSYVRNFGAQTVWDAIGQLSKEDERTWAELKTILRASDTRYVKEAHRH